MKKNRKDMTEFGAAATAEAAGAAGSLARYAAEIEEALGALLPLCPFPGGEVAEAMKYSLSGGKKIRGALVLAFYKLYRKETAPALPFACALEMIHAYSLIHDDLPCMDDDDMRRGKPSCHRAFGEATALLAGDALLTLAFAVMGAAGRRGEIPDGNILDAVSCLAEAAGITGMVGGQAMDLALEGKNASGPQIEEMYAKKTGALISAAAQIGCILAGAGGEELAAARLYAGRIGFAFQIRDDILDITGDGAVLGKPVGSDAKQEKSTYAGLVGTKEAERLVLALSAQAKEALAALPGDTGFLRELADMLAGRQK